MPASSSPSGLLSRPGLRRTWPALLLSLALVVAQLLVVGHQAEHLTQPAGDGTPCALCLLGGTLGHAAPADAGRVVAGAVAEAPAGVPGIAPQCPPPFLARPIRAPPARPLLA